MGKMRGGKVKIVKQKMKSSGSGDQQDLYNMFNQITGASGADRAVILPKINKIYKNIADYNRLYSTLIKFDVFTKQFDDNQHWFGDITVFLKDLLESTKIDLSKDYSDDDMRESYHELDDDKLNIFYKDLKDNIQIKKIIITGSNLASYKKYLTAETLDGVFINKEPGLTFKPLSFTDMDLKIVWSVLSNDKAKQFILSILKYTYTIGIDMYDIITSPDIDIKKFSKILIESISQMKKHIPRCEKAFKIIENSVSMLESNFKNYFRGSVEAGNPSIIIESFIVDLSTSQKSGIAVSREFRHIIAFLQKQSANNNDPKVKKLFSMLNDQFKSLDSEMGKNKAAPEEDEFIADGYDMVDEVAEKISTSEINDQ